MKAVDEKKLGDIFNVLRVMIRGQTVALEKEVREKRSLSSKDVSNLSSVVTLSSSTSSTHKRSLGPKSMSVSDKRRKVSDVQELTEKASSLPGSTHSSFKVKKSSPATTSPTSMAALSDLAAENRVRVFLWKAWKALTLLDVNDVFSVPVSFH